MSSPAGQNGKDWPESAADSIRGLIKGIRSTEQKDSATRKTLRTRSETESVSAGYYPPHVLKRWDHRDRTAPPVATHEPGRGRPMTRRRNASCTPVGSSATVASRRACLPTR